MLLVKTLAPLVAGTLAWLALSELDPHARSALAISAAMILAWIVESLHPALVGFIGSFLFCAAGGVDFETAFAGFGTTTPWFLYGTLLVLNAAEESGVVARLRTITPRALTRSTVSAGIVLVALAYALAFVVPAPLARAAMLALAASAWSASTAWSRTVLMLVAGYAAAAFGHPTLPGGPSAIGGWDAAVAVALIAGVFAATRRAAVADDHEARGAEAWTTNRAAAALVAVTIGLWVTAPFHRASPDLVGLAAGLACVLPGVRRASGPHARPTADPLAIILVGTAISIPAVLLETNAAEALSRYWSALTAQPGPLPEELVTYWTTTAYRMLSPDAARPALPVLDGTAGQAGTSAAWAYAGSTLLSLHQSAALALAMSLAGVRARHVLFLGALVFVAGSVVVMVF